MTEKGTGACEGEGVGLAPMVGDGVAEVPGGSGEGVGESVLRGGGRVVEKEGRARGA